MPAFLTDDALEPVKLDRGDRHGMLSLLDAASVAVAATVQQHIVDRKVNNSRTIDQDDPAVIATVS